MFPDSFINIPFSHDYLDIFITRKGILDAVKTNIREFKGDMLDIGCGKMPYKEFLFSHSSIKTYTGLDIENALEYAIDVKPDFTWDGIKMPFTDNRFHSAFGTEVLEHCPRPEIILSEVSRVLKPGGVFFFTVPFLWPLHEVPHDEYRFTPFALHRLLQEAGFENIDIKAIGGWHAAMAQMLGLWTKEAQLVSEKGKCYLLF